MGFHFLFLFMIFRGGYAHSPLFFINRDLFLKRGDHSSGKESVDTKGGKWVNRKHPVVKVALTRSIPCINFHGECEVN